MMAARVIGPNEAEAFVPDGDSRSETATVLIALALDHGLDVARSVYSTQGGFFITDELADLLYEDEDSGVDPASVQTVSGNPPAPAYDPSEGDMDAVKAYVTENPEQAKAVLEAETQGKNRSTLTKWLSEFIDNASGNRAAKNDGTNKE